MFSTLLRVVYLSSMRPYGLSRYTLIIHEISYFDDTVDVDGSKKLIPPSSAKFCIEKFSAHSLCSAYMEVYVHQTKKNLIHKISQNNYIVKLTIF